MTGDGAAGRGRAVRGLGTARAVAARVGTTALVLLGAMLLLFALSALVPGDPATALLGPAATPEYAARFVQEMGLDQPWPRRLGTFLAHVAVGDLGTDALSGQRVTAVVGAVMPYTFILTFAAIGLAVATGVPLGCYAATHRGGAADGVLAAASVTLIAVPSFVIAIGLLLLFSAGLTWFPVLGAGDPGSWRDQALRLVLPTLSLSVGWIGYIARLVRSAMLEVLEEPYIRTARAYGMPRGLVTYKYALKNAALPVLAVLGLGIGRLLGGAVLVEIVFARPGLGRLIFDAISTRNFPVLQGAVLVVVLVFVLTNLVVDLGFTALDPRLRRRGAG